MIGQFSGLYSTVRPAKFKTKNEEQNTETDNLNFRVGFLEFLQKDEHEEDNSSEELDNLIAAERSSNTVEKI